MAKDPVCGMTVDEESPHKSTHSGKNYVFCSTSCKTKFEEDPGQYAPRLEESSALDRQPVMQLLH